MARVDEILSLLKKLNFSKTEAAVYVDLLKNSSLNGYQIAKNLNISRSSVYSALDNLYKKGVVFLLPGDSQIYKAEDPSVLTNKMKDEFVEAADLLEIKLQQLKTTDSEERYLNIEGYNNVVAKVKELLLIAKKEVYINTDFDLQIFSKEFIELQKRSVRIIIFSFSKVNGENLPVEIYKHDDYNCFGKQTRIMLVVDCKKTLVADKGPNREEFLGTFTENALLTAVVSEHIHNDIYLLKLKKIYKKNLINKDIKLNTMFENR
ncbi:Sugar-specific transcriptional regulator TrmB [Clostridium acidisoli DSM 12555]|uniref:Sugar-specific transcriptional regulator TrmB n=1 Tax=Clostridium acidisoli DSM 12555 TaxID=1121291 RepID=A0A1W1X9V3_9CLOT|nr:helix-turn-helix domain-containing protein [Clostridium acidisoli]SMC20785.1 Sugar-specific transcriptional regulator TrmB [Clostridium acidisoli DSM 12555]